MPSLLTTYANSVTRRLPALEVEDFTVYQHLLGGMTDNRYVLIRESYATTHSLGFYLRLFRDDLFLFHFSGHAGKHELILEDQSVGGTGILSLIKACRNLQLVVLNGCSTAPLAQAVHAAVPVVIGTTAKVGDESARIFSIRL
jgi:hypothetical protein